MADASAGAITVDEAVARVLALAASRRLATETVSLHESVGRVLAGDVIAGHDLPPFANSAMDGFAVRGADLAASGETRLRIAGTRYAGDTETAAIGAGECLRITTGAPLPRGADTVVIKERVRIEGDFLVVPASEKPGANVRAAGEDIARGARALAAGEVVGAARLGVLASLGCAHVEVVSQPQVAVLSTGDELVMPGQPLGHAQIHDSNGYGLAALAAEAGARIVDALLPFRHVRDDERALREALLAAAAEADVIVTSGGVSAGEKDLLPALVAELGEIAFWKVRMRPGMPVLCGTLGGTVVVGLPGNPVSGVVTFLLFVRPLLRALQGIAEPSSPRLHAQLSAPIAKRHDRAEFMRARLEPRADATLGVRVLPKQGSGMLHGVVGADALVVVPEHARELEAGHVVEVIALPAGY